MTVDPMVLNAALLGVVALTNAIAAYITNSLAAKRAKVAENSNDRRERKLDVVTQVAEKTHKLVNGKMSEVLTALVVSAQALYKIDSSDANFNLLTLAKENLRLHLERQRDAGRVVEGAIKGDIDAGH